jgi:hypothetical protein
MRLLFQLASSLIHALSPLSRTSASREGFPPDSPFRESVVLTTEIVTQGIAVGDVNSHGRVTLHMYATDQTVTEYEEENEDIFQKIGRKGHQKKGPIVGLD